MPSIMSRVAAMPATAPCSSVWSLWSVWFIRSIRFIWSDKRNNETNQTDEIDQINQTDRIDQTNSPRLASPARRALPALCPSNQIYEIDRYGSPFSQDSINNPFGAGSPYRPDSPTNLYEIGRAHV